MTKIKPFTIVVTGGLGFIGSRFIKYVYDNTVHNIINIDKHTYAADPARIPEHITEDEERYTFLKLDVCSNDLSKYHKVNGTWIDCGTFDSLAKATQKFYNDKN